VVISSTIIDHRLASAINISFLENSFDVNVDVGVEVSEPCFLMCRSKDNEPIS